MPCEDEPTVPVPGQVRDGVSFRTVSETLSAVVAPRGEKRTVAALYIGLSGDAPRGAPARLGLGGVDRVVMVRGEQRRISRGRAGGGVQLDIALPDPRMSSTHLRLSRLGTAWFAEDLGSKNGTWVGGARITRHPLRDGDVLLVGHTALVFRDAGGEVDDLDGVPAAPAPGLATTIPALAERFASVARAARAPAPIAVTGATGTGKELVARAVHELSGRRGTFVSVNCGALPPTLIEAELFGHKKGAFTGAGDERAGLVRSSDGGTLFLDEIAELPAASQTAFLRVLQESVVTPIGADRGIPVDLRVVTATHRDLDADVDEGRFRADLRARLLGVTVTLPPLRERREDLGMLVATLLDRLAPARRVTFSADAVAALYAYGWPLNVRELERALVAALAIADERIELAHLPTAVQRPLEADDAGGVALPADEQQLRDRLADAISRHDGNLAAVARELGKDRTQIRRWMKRFGLARSDDDAE
jgi:DNA-binding NtrC family response regulator